MTSIKQRPSIYPLVIVTFIYFIVGFLTTVNEQLQAPLQFTFLHQAGDLKNTLTTLVSFFFFLGYLMTGNVGSKWVNKYGYQNTLLRGLMFIILGLSMYLCSSIIGDRLPHIGLHVKGAAIPLGFFVFLLGSYLMGTSAAVIQVVVNPYVASYDLPGTQAVQRLNITTAVNSIGTTSAPFFVTAIIFGGIPIENVQVKQLMVPLMLLICCVVIVLLVTKKVTIPDIANTRMEKDEKLERSIWSFRHFALGVLAIFFYVGTEVSIGANINLYAFELMDKGHPVTFFGKSDIVVGGMDLGIHALLSTLYWGGFLVGRLVSSFLNHISAKVQLTITTILATIFAIVAIATQNIWFLVAIGLLHSTMWSCIYSLAIKGLKKYTSKASGVFVSAVFGGAVFTLLQGGLADILDSWRWTWTLTIVCELLMLSYALFGSKIRKQDILE